MLPTLPTPMFYKEHELETFLEPTAARVSEHVDKLVFILDDFCKELVVKLRNAAVYSKQRHDRM